MQQFSDIPVTPNDARLYETIFSTICSSGLKGMTMDSLAKRLGMSKRTLYEKFDSKSDMMVRVMTHMGDVARIKYEEMFRGASDMMQAMLLLFEDRKQFMLKTDVSFFTDMDTLFPEVKECFRRTNARNRDRSEELYIKGIEEGVFRPGVNYQVLNRLLHIQMEALKRMEEVFPPGITITEAYDTIYMSYLRSIATEKGIRVLEQYEKENQLTDKNQKP